LPSDGSVPLINGFTLVGLSNSTKVVAPGFAAGKNTFYGFHRTGGGLGGNGRLDGLAVANVLAIFNISVPLDPVGNTSQYVPFPFPTFRVTYAVGTGWTTGQVTMTGITTETPNGLVINTVTFDARGFDNRAADHRGVVQLVSPFKVVSGLGNLPGYALQMLIFVPEPGGSCSSPRGSRPSSRTGAPGAAGSGQERVAAGGPLSSTTLPSGSRTYMEGPIPSAP
jgi:hypothetical protein